MLENETALVTGSTQGIGLAIARSLAQAGAHIVLHGMESQEEGDAIAAGMATAYGVRAAYVCANLTHAEQAEGLVAAATGALAAPSILVNNAGIQHTCGIDSFPAERWDAILAVNLTAAFYTMKSVVPGMRTRGWGRIVNIASVHGLVASVNKGAYLAAKHGLVGLSKGVALETATQGITVNCICPGWTDTAIIQPQIDLRAAQFGGDRNAGIRDLLSEKQPNQTLLPPERIGEVAVFLCSNSAAGITGVALPVDGGWTAQ
ncbi:3-hydroxybutyrate dehydrogenase [Rhodoferax sp. AJA081-3]|uniref:3-hydroxybutyrate dehydrogenase n=1 Tax=Rhodoferax sp. AJA081-3 TaxID=2752316 RepID=UPI001AE01D40|nr:3-hydroxybutyrate dehydrogenase [Rhodoferax sp. AJA081-3]QTN29925.1 3-hydroxybutyrate dehydrogenase [Rhodoferax sp. AJA081-3]